ncbi:DUF362 domain-containing protein [Methanobacterium oryzae]|uniref:DUF362 domain-containing protein n=1 Tax=Methanobacterium oryzae TaxID=69540 RepID=UPI003D1AB64A
MTRISISECQSYNIKDVQNAVNCCLDNLGGISSFIKPESRVLIKPNVLIAKAPKEAATTHPIIIEAIINSVKSAGAVPIVGDSPGGPVGNLERYWKATGIREVCNRLDIEIVNFESAGVYKKKLNGNHYYISKQVLDADFIINVPKIKTHGLTVFTCAIKNMYGVVPGLKKTEYHKEAPKPSDFSKLVVDIFSLSKPRLNIVDGIIGMEGMGPSAGNPKELGMILVSTDAIALDSYICHILGKDPMKVPITKIAYEKGLGEADINRIEIMGHKPEVMKDFKWPPNLASSLDMIPSSIAKGLMKFYWSRPAIDSDLCTNCKTCVKSCPVEALSNGVYIPEFDYPECINCLCCAEMCPEKAVYLEKSVLTKLFSRSD